MGKNKDERITVPTTEELAIFAFVGYLAGMFPELWGEALNNGHNR